uniref:5-methyltetrahydropteroyltriglutamate--homocysteine S-methyltransferase n=1 Tax=Bionectria ochroleuca TaxID=29856 RepID=A0A8H7NL74_BIOOC
MVQSAILGFPRMGVNRDLKKATEAYWGGKISQADLLAEAKRLRLAHWKIQQDAGVDVIPSNDFALYDHVLNHIQDFGAVPPRYTKDGLDLVDQYFAMGRGHQKNGIDVPSLEMVKWFDSNYHYVKPTLQNGQTFKLADEPKAVAAFNEAKEAGIKTRPVLVGPVSFLHLGKADRDQTVDPIDLLDALLPVYEQLLVKLKEAGAETVQIDEPTLVFDLPAKSKAAFKPAYEKLASLGDKIPKLVFTTYFGDIVHNLDVLPKDVYAVHVDLVRNPEQLDEVIGALGPKTILSAGVVDGRNIWKTNFKRAIETVETAVQKLGKDRVIAATSSSLLHTPTLSLARRSSTLRLPTGSLSPPRRPLRSPLLPRPSLRALLPSASSSRPTPSLSRLVPLPAAPTTPRSRTASPRSPRLTTSASLSSPPEFLFSRRSSTFPSSLPPLLVPSLRPRRSVSSVTASPRVKSPRLSTTSSSRRRLRRTSRSRRSLTLMSLSTVSPSVTTWFSSSVSA